MGGGSWSKLGSYGFFEEMIKVYYVLDNLPWETSGDHNYVDVGTVSPSSTQRILPIFECGEIEQVHYYF